MIGFFRSFFQSKIGLFFTMAFVAVIAVAFASSDITSGVFGGVSGSQTVAVVGDEDVTTSEFRREINGAYGSARQNDPNLTLPAFLTEDTVDRIFDRMINGHVISQYAQNSGIGAGKRLIDSEIANSPAFSNVAGDFDEQSYRAQLQAQGFAEVEFRELVARSLYAEQLLTPLTYGLKMPADITKTYAQITLQARRGRIAAVPSTLFLDDKEVSDKALKEFYTEKAADFTIPEQRQIQYAVFNRTQVVDQVAITETDIKAAYESRREEFEARETRTLQQVILPTEDGAKALLAAIKGGKAIDAAASNIGLAASNLGPLTKGELSSQASNAVADKVFATKQGELAEVAQSALGWHVVKVNKAETVAAKSIDDVRTELEREVREEKSRQALSDFTVALEEQIEDGASLSEIAKKENLELKKTPMITAGGISPKNREYKADPIVRIILQDAFQLEEGGNARLKETTQGLEYVLFDVPQITASAPPPFAENKAAILQAYRFAKAADEAEKAARKIAAATKDADSLAKAMADSGLRLPPVENVGATREQLANSEQRVPPPLALMFSMKEGTTKVLEGPADQVWYVVYLQEIVQGDLSKRPDIIASAERDLNAAYSGELQQQFINAMRGSVEIERKETIIKSVLDDLTGANVSG